MRWAWLGGVMLFVLACGITVAVNENHVRVRDLPQFICPSSTPRPTATQVATAVAPPIYRPPSGWVTSYQWVCQWVWTGTTYVQQCQYLPVGGYYSTPAHTVPGATSTPRPTHTPYPTPTPYVVSENYALGAQVFVGDRSALALRLRVDAPQITVLDAERQVVVWEVQLKNLGRVPYQTLPGAQVFIREVGGHTGYWYASADALLAAGLPADDTILDILELAPNQTVRLTLAAFTPLGTVEAVGWMLDPYSGGIGQGIVGGNTAVWRNESDPFGCVGNVDDLPVLPTRGIASPTPTPSLTPWIPNYAGATRAP